jgi:hypothetical protein
MKQGGVRLVVDNVAKTCQQKMSAGKHHMHHTGRSFRYSWCHTHVSAHLPTNRR